MCRGNLFTLLRSLRATFVFSVVGWGCPYHKDHEDPTKHKENEMDLEDQKN
jgi:hypothetical protein